VLAVVWLLALLLLPRPARTATLVVNTTLDDDGTSSTNCLHGTDPCTPRGRSPRRRAGTASSSRLMFYVVRQTAGQASTVSLTVTGGRGAWPTFVGGGPSAF
jgi:hypothetical protein